MGAKTHRLTALGVLTGLGFAGACYAGGTGALIIPAPTDLVACHAAAAGIQHMILAAYASGLQADGGLDGLLSGHVPLPMLAEFDRQEQVSAAPFCKGLRANMRKSGIAFVDEVPARGRQKVRPGKLVVSATSPVLSADGTEAMMRVGLRCGGNCSGSATYYLVHKENHWRIGGFRAE